MFSRANQNKKNIRLLKDNRWHAIFTNRYRNYSAVFVMNETVTDFVNSSCSAYDNAEGTNGTIFSANDGIIPSTFSDGITVTQFDSFLSIIPICLTNSTWMSILFKRWQWMHGIAKVSTSHLIWRLTYREPSLSVRYWLNQSNVTSLNWLIQQLRKRLQINDLTVRLDHFWTVAFVQWYLVSLWTTHYKIQTLQITWS